MFEGVMLFHSLYLKRALSHPLQRSIYARAPADVNLWYYSFLTCGVSTKPPLLSSLGIVQSPAAAIGSPRKLGKNTPVQ